MATVYGQFEQGHRISTPTTRHQLYAFCKQAYLISTHLLHRVYVLNLELKPVNLSLQPFARILQINLSPFLDERSSAVRFGSVARVGTGHVWRKCVVVAALLDGDALQILILVWDAEESGGKVERRFKHAVL